MDIGKSGDREQKLTMEARKDRRRKISGAQWGATVGKPGVELA